MAAADAARPGPPAPPALARRAALVLSIAAANLVLDRVTKVLAEAALAGRGRLSWLGDTVRLELVHNTGAFLGLGASLSPGARSALFVAGGPGLLLAAGRVAHAVDRHVVVVGQDAADPHRGRHLIFGVADALADQVFRLVDAGVGMDIDAGMAEEA